MVNAKKIADEACKILRKDNGMMHCFVGYFIRDDGVIEWDIYVDTHKLKINTTDDITTDRLVELVRKRR
jgi:hypothetical protein